MVDVVITALGIAAIGYSAYTDLKYGKILNIITIPTILIVLGIIALTCGGELIISIKWGLFAWAITIVPILLGLLGGGDGKLLALCGVVFGESVIQVIVYFLVITFIWFFVRDSIYNKSVLKTLYSLILFKNFTDTRIKYNLGGLFILIASVANIIKEMVI